MAGEYSFHPTSIGQVDLAEARDSLMPIVAQPKGLETIPDLNDLLGYNVLFHPEFRHTDSRTGSFKDNGATYKILRGEESGELGDNDIIAISSGNHAIAVANAASQRGYEPLIVMAETTSPVKIREARAYGAQVFTEGVTIFNRIGIFESLADQTGRYRVPAFDDITIATGHGGGAGITMVNHLNELPADKRVHEILIPVGGGGLIAGVSAAVKHYLGYKAHVIGVEPEDAADGRQSFAAKEIVGLREPSKSVADGIQTQKLGDNIFPVILENVDGFAEGVPERFTVLAHRIMEHAFATNGEHIEPTSAVALGSLLRDFEHGVEHGNTAIFISGGNWHPDHAGDNYKNEHAALKRAFDGGRLARAGIFDLAA